MLRPGDRVKVGNDLGTIIWIDHEGIWIRYDNPKAKCSPVISHGCVEKVY